MRRLALILAAGLLLPACGEQARTATTAEPRVQLKLSLPDDREQTREDSISVSGTVSPADAAVRVAGEEAEVDGGAFTASVALDPGRNVIDVTASSPGRRPAVDAVRVTRDMRVPVPKVIGLEVEQAQAALNRAGLRSEVQRVDGWLDRVIPGTTHVCATEPDVDTPVDRQSVVTLLTQRDC